MEHVVPHPGDAIPNMTGAREGWEYVRCNLCGADDFEIKFPSTVAGNVGSDPATPNPGPAAHLQSPGPAAYTCTNLGYGVHPPIVRCRNCSLIYTNPRRAAGALQAAYAEVVDELYLEEREGRVLTFERRLDAIETLARPGRGRRLLDVGCHVGIFVGVAAAHRWDAWGVEPSRWAAEQARASGLQVVNGTLSDADFEPRSFDVVTLWDVVEHLIDPAAELRRAWQLLRPGGLIAIHTMDIQSPFGRIMGSRWPWLMEMHLVYFTPATLSALLNRAGFEVMSYHRQGRYLRLGYLVSRLAPYTRVVAHTARALVDRLGLASWPMPINLGDLFTIYARKSPINRAP